MFSLFTNLPYSELSNRTLSPSSTIVLSLVTLVPFNNIKFSIVVSVSCSIPSVDNILSNFISADSRNIKYVLKNSAKTG